MPRPTNMSTKTRFGIIICNRLKEMGKNQKYLAQRTGLSQLYVSEVLNGRHKPSVKTVYAISKVTGIGIKELAEALLDES